MTNHQPELAAYPRQYLEELFDNLVGQPDSQTAFYGALAESTRATPPESAYRALAITARRLIADAVDRVPNQHELPANEHFAALASLKANGATGARLTVTATAALARTYTRRALYAQPYSHVSANLDATLRHIKGIAHSDALAAAISIGGMASNINPRSTSLGPFAAFAFILSRHFNIPLDRSFSIAEDSETGALTIKPRYQRARGTTNRHCPAATIKLSQSESGAPSALLTCMRVIGSVALHEIYPRQFGIYGMPGTATEHHSAA